VYSSLDKQIGYQLKKVDASKPWLILGTLLALVAAGTAIGMNRRLP
jgi:Ca-activated chloride channel family protein